MTPLLTWERVDTGETPAPYFTMPNRQWAIFGAKGSRDWELCWQPSPDSGYDLIGFHSTVAAAKDAAERSEARDLAGAR